jgi:hypothetical protein
MENVFHFERRRTFTIESARELLPIVYRASKNAYDQVQGIINQIDKMDPKNESAIHELDSQINTVISQWKTKLTKLGVEAKGVWIADFDSGDGYFCWKFPELDIKFWHDYEKGFNTRIPIENKNK